MNEVLYKDLLNATTALLLIDKKKKERKTILQEANDNHRYAVRAYPEEAHPGVRMVWGSILLVFGLFLFMVALTADSNGDISMGISFGICCTLPGVILWIRAIKVKKRHDQWMAEYNKYLADAEKGMHKAKETAARLEAEIAELEDKHREVISVLPSTYHDATAASYILLAIKDGRADNLKEAMNLYEQQKHHWELENVLTDMVKMQKIQNMYVNNALSEIQRNQESLHQELRVVQALQVASLASNSF